MTCSHENVRICCTENSLELLMSRQRLYLCTNCDRHLVRTETWSNTLFKYPLRVLVFLVSSPVVLFYNMYHWAH